MDLGLSGATVVVNGGSKGMGRAAAETFAREGAKIAVLARGEEALAKTVVALREAGAADALHIRTDITDASQVEAAFAQLGERWGELNVLVNATGPVDMIGIGPLEKLSDDDWRATFEVGTLGAMRCVRAALPLLRASEWARIVNVSAQSTRRQSPGLVAYTAAKAALTSLSKNLSQSLAPEGILVNTVSPGSFLSAGLRTYLAQLPEERGIDPDDLPGRDARHLGGLRTPRLSPSCRRSARDRSGDRVFGLPPEQLHDRRRHNVDGGSDF